MQVPSRFVKEWEGPGRGRVDTRVEGLYVSMGEPPMSLWGCIYAEFGREEEVELTELKQLTEKTLWKLLQSMTGGRSRARFSAQATASLAWWSQLAEERYIIPYWHSFTVDWSAVAIDELWNVHAAVATREAIAHIGNPPPDGETWWWTRAHEVGERWAARFPHARGYGTDMQARRQHPGSRPVLEHYSTPSDLAREARDLFESCPFRDRELH